MGRRLRRDGKIIGSRGHLVIVSGFIEANYDFSIHFVNSITVGLVDRWFL